VISGIGGKVEPLETFRAAALREFEEETGEQVEIVAAAEPRHLSAEAATIPVPQGAAALLATRVPDGARDRLLWIAIFLGTLAARPQPVEKVPYFIVIPPSAFPLLGRAGPPDLDALSVIAGSEVRPAREVLPTEVTGADAVLTARAVLADPDLLSQWWTASGRSHHHEP